MIRLDPPRGPLRVLFLGAHPDDIEIGCGGTLLELADRPETEVWALVLTGEDDRVMETTKAMSRFFPGSVVEHLGLRDGRLPAEWDATKNALEHAGRRYAPDIIFAPRTNDAHQDHRLVGSLASTVWRDALIFHYEIPKWDADLAPPNHYVPISDENAHRKVALLNECFLSQVARDWWDDELFLGLMRLRGIECRSHYAEGFTVTKAVMNFRSKDGRP